MEIGPDKTKMMTNNPNGCRRETKIKMTEAISSGELQVLWSKYNSKMSSFKSNENIHKKEGGSYYVVSANKASSVTL